MAMGTLYGDNVETIVVKAVFDDDGVKTGMKEVEKITSKVSKGVETQSKFVKTSSGQWRKMGQTVKKARSEFQAWALSFLFGGMAIKRMGDTIARSSTQTFLQITQGQTEAGESLIGLTAAWKFLQFEIGQAIGTALKPLLPILVFMIEKFALFVQKNPAKVFAAIGTAIVTGGLLMFIGQFVLFTAALPDAIENMKKFGKVIMKIKMPEKLIEGWKYIKNNPLKSGLVAGLITGIILAIAWILKAKDEMGGWGEFWKNVGRGMIRVTGVVAAAIGAAFGSLFEGLIRERINPLIESYNRVASLLGLRSISTIGTTGMSFSQMFGAQMEQFENTAQTLFGKPEKGFVGDRSISQILKADLYDDIETTAGATDQSVNIENLVINQSGGSTGEAVAGVQNVDMYT